MSGTEKKNYQTVKSYIRQRPFTRSEIELRCPSIVQKLTSNEIIIKSGVVEKKYAFDKVFGDEVPQHEIYNVVVHPLIDYIVSGYNCTVFAYGQTGTGKTHTMLGGTVGANIDFSNDPSVGIIPRAAAHLFSQLNKLNAKIEYTVNLSFVEIYNEEVRDLLISESPSLRIYDDPDHRGSVCIRGLTEITVFNINEVYDWFIVGTLERQTAMTNLNRHSSRSHTIFTLVVHTRETTVGGEELMKTGKLHLIDLAGSENIGRSGATEMRAREAGTINKSLLTLGKVIKALAQKAQHIPYRDSKLTRILQDSLGGKTKTCMIATFSPCVNEWDETVSTLDYAYVARSVANCPQINVNRKQANVMKELKCEISRLHQELSAARTGDGFYMTLESYEKMSQDIEKKNHKAMELVKEIQRLEEHRHLKEQQYQELNESFHRTKSYLENLSQELEEKKVQEQQKEYVINYMNGRNEELNAAANDLLKICKVSTEHKDIFHKKYEATCNATVMNGNIAKNIYSASINCMKEIQNLTENFLENQKTSLSEVGANGSYLKTDQIGNLEQLSQLTLKLQSEFSNYNLKVDHILKDDYSETNIQNYLSSILLRNNSLESERHEEIKNCIDILKNHVVTKSAEMEVESAHCLTSVSEECVTELKIQTLLRNLYENMCGNISRAEQEVCNETEIQSTLKQYLLQSEKKKKDVLDAILSMKQTNDDLLVMIKRYEDKNPLSIIKEALVNYKEHQSESIKTQLSLIENAITNIEAEQISRQKQIVSDENQTKQYFSGLVESVRENVERFNAGSENSLQNFVKEASVIKRNLLKTTVEHVDSLHKTIEHISNCEDTYNNDQINMIQQTSQHLHSLEENIILQTHAGDTPAKTVFRYPKITNGVPVQVLLEQFNNNGQGSSLSVPNSNPSTPS